MNSVINKLKSVLRHKKSFSGIVISVVILVEVIAILFVATFSWVETISSIKIKNDSDTSVTGANMLKIDSYVFTEADIGGETGTIDLGKYFKPAGGMHLAPASSSDGKTMFFPKVGATNYYRKGNTSDMNTNYMSVTFKLTADTNADFFFTGVPTFSANSGDIRVSVTSRSEGEDISTEETNIYALNASASGSSYTASVTQSVVDTAAGSTHSATIYSFDDHKKGSSSDKKLFDVEADETKIVTINLWLQSDSTWSAALSQNITISDFGITSDLSPRHVTLVPTNVWDILSDDNNNNEVFYAWCWDSSKDSPKLFMLEKDDYGNYGFSYNGTYQKMVFIRAPGSYRETYHTGDDVDNNNTFWNGIWSQTNDTKVPATPVNPTYVIKSYGTGSGSSNKSTGAWVLPAVVKLKYVNGQDSSWGTLTGTFKGITSSYVGVGSVSGETLNEVKMLTVGKPCAPTGYPNNGSESDPETASTDVFNDSYYTYSVTGSPASDQYAFVGWFADPEGTTAATFSNASVSGNTTTARTSSYDVEKTYYAKFKAVRNIKLYQRIDDAAGTGAGDLYLKVGSSETKSTGATSSSITKVVDLGAELLVGAKVYDSGYQFLGICNSQSYDASSVISSTPTTTDGITYYTISNVSSDANYYAHFAAKTYTVAASANTGGTVKVGTNGTQSTSSSASVKYKKSVKLYAYPNTGYKFVGWYTNSSYTGTPVTSDEYNYTLSTTGDKTFYAKFEPLDIYLTGYLDKSDVTTAQNKYKFTQLTSDPSKFVLEYIFLNNGSDGTSELQYPTIFDGTNAYHPESHASGSGTVGSTVDTSPGANNKWKVDASNGARVVFEWDASDNSLSWTVYYRIYFDKTNVSSQFSDVYITLNPYWDSGNNGAGSNDRTFAQMTQISGTNLYYYETDDKPDFTAVAFVKDNQPSYYNFYNTKASYRTDFSLTSPVFKPNSSPTEWHNGTEYYNTGSWKKYS